MSFTLMFFFIIIMIISAFMQAEDHPQKKFVSPGLTASCGLLILVGTLLSNVPLSQGITLSVALVLLAASDFMFERSGNNETLFPIAIAFGMISGFTIGILFNVVAISQGIPWSVLIAFVTIGVILAIGVYRYLDVDPALKIPITIYLIQAIILMAGGLSSLYVGNIFFAIWGISIFVTDSLVGIRAFPSQKRPFPYLNDRRILFLIIVIYYAAQYALAAWAIS